MTTVTASSDITRWAGAAVARGWHVFPLARGTKVPPKGMSWPAAAANSLDGFDWTRTQGYGIAAKNSRLIIVDCDMPKPGFGWPPEWATVPGMVDGRDVLATLAELHGGAQWPSTFTVATPSGGWHLYYTAPAGRKIGNRPLGPLTDIRGGGETNGGYVAGPGTIINGRQYEVIDADGPVALPGWLADLLDPPASLSAANQFLTAPPRAADPVGAYSRMRGILDRLSSARTGDRRNDLLNWSAYQFAEMIAAGEIGPAAAENALYLAAEENGHVAKHGERATRATIASGMRQAVSA
jgi:Bifunctional DNA primase/polymerase, N-terminal